MDADEAGEDEAEGLRNVAEGLRLVLLGLVASAAIPIGFVVVAALFLRIDPAQDPVAIAQALRRSTLLRSLNADHPAAATVLNGLVVLASVLGVAGKVFCARGPGASRAAGPLIASIVFDALGLALYAAGQVGPASEAAAELVDAAPLPWMLAYFLFLRGLARLAEHLKSPPLIRLARRQQVGSIAALLGMFLAAALAGPGGAAGALMAGAVVSLAVLVLFFLYIRLVRDLRRAVEAKADTASELG